MYKITKNCHLLMSQKFTSFISQHRPFHVALSHTKHDPVFEPLLAYKSTQFWLAEDVFAGKTMDEKKAMQRELYTAISCMEQKGIVDDHFIMTYQLKETTGPNYFAETIPMFCSDTEASIVHMTSLLQLPILDYYSLDQLCIKIRGSSSCLGVHKLALVAKELRDACKAASRLQCAYVFENLKEEFRIFKESGPDHSVGVSDPCPGREHLAAVTKLFWQGASRGCLKSMTLC